MTDAPPALSVAEALAALAKLESPPLVTLSLAGGASLRGWIAAAGVMQLAEPDGRRGHGAAYFDARQVIAVAISDARALASSTPAVQVPREPVASAPPPSAADAPADGTAPPSRMELARAATDLGERLTNRLATPYPVMFAWKGIDTSSPRQMLAAQELLALVEAELKTMLADTGARRALTQKTRGLEIANGELRGVALVRDVLRISAPLAESAADRFDGNTLRVALNRAL